MKNLFFLFLCLILFNCSSNDDDNTNDNPSRTFLENYAGTGWLQDNNFFLRFINNLSAPIETWSVSTDCYSYELLNLAEDNIEITENSENRLILKYGPSDGYSGTFTLTVSGNNMELEDKYESPGDSGIDILNFTKTLEDLDGFIKCE